jgi:hypothetical protein
MFFEVENLNQASPAIVSRCGMIYMNADEIEPIVLWNTWIE